jgi:beta-mannanase
LTAPARRSVVLSTAVLLAASSALALATQGSSQAATATKPIIFGAAADNQTQVTADERVIGRHMEGIRDYKSWDSTLFGSSQLWMRDTGHTLFLSIKAQRINGTRIKFADIAAAKPGSALYSDMQGMAAQIKAYKSTVYIILNHEPEASGSNPNGTGPQFAAAWRTFVTIMRASGVTNAKYVATFTGYGFSRKDAYNVNNYYPGDAYVDAVAADVYNWGACRSQPWTPLWQLVTGIYAFGQAHPAKPLMLMEFGSVEDASQPGRKAQWLADAEAMFKEPTYAQFTAVLHWAGTNTTPECSFNYTTSSSATAAFKTFGNDPSYLANPS